MILFDVTGADEANEIYQELEASNVSRQYDFLISLIQAAAASRRPLLSQQIIKALNYHAISCLHINAGEYRPCKVEVGDYMPPAHYQVPALVDDLVNVVNRIWETSDPVSLAALVLWQLNRIHPFINGNGRTARAACYFVLCLKLGTLLPGNIILPELIRQNRDKYIIALKMADQGDPKALHEYLQALIEQQIATAGPPNPAEPVGG